MSDFLKALTGKNQRIPIWFMRQVGRYLPEYQKLKKGYSLKDLFHNQEFIVEATLLAPRILDVDAAILFSDILVILDGFSIPYDFSPEMGPKVDFFPSSLEFSSNPKEIFLPITKGIKILKQELNIPLIGFSGSPFTLACYLIDGGTSKDFKKTGIFMYQNPNLFSEIINQLIDATCTYLELQIESGVDAIQLFDSCTHRLSGGDFLTYCVEPNRKIINYIHKKYDIPIILFCRNSSFYYRELCQTGANCLSIDWLTPIKTIQQHAIPISLQGNMDPLLLCSSKQKIREYLDQNLIQTENYIFNTGHGLVPETIVDNVKFTIDYVRNKF